jgi:hypothetical protein
MPPLKPPKKGPRKKTSAPGVIRLSSNPRNCPNELGDSISSLHAANRRVADLAGSPCIRHPAGGLHRLKTASVLEECCILLDEVLLFLGHILQRMDRIRGACRNASAAVDASLGIDIHLSCRLEAGLVRLWVDTIGRANLNAEGVFDAGISNYIGHDEPVSWMSTSLAQE